MLRLPSFPRVVWQLLTADMASAVGSGLITPFLVIYLSSARGLGQALVGVILSETAMAGLVGNLLGGALSDRWGPRPVLLAGLAMAAFASLGWIVVDRPLTAVVVAALVGIGDGIAGPSLRTLLVRFTEPTQRSTVFAIGYTILNLGFGVGGMLGGLFIGTDLRNSFIPLLVLNAVSYLVAALLVARTPVKAVVGVLDDGRPAHAGVPNDAEGPRVGYLQIFRDPVFIRLWLLALLVVTAGFAPFAVTVPIVLVEHGGLPASVLAAVYTVNTATVVVSQMIVLRIVANRRRTRALMAMCLLWALSWLSIGLGTLSTDQDLLTVLALSAAALLALGETLMAPTMPAIVNAIAPDALRGRYNGAFMLSNTAAHLAGPVIAGLALGQGLVLPLLFGLVAVCCSCTIAVFRIERRIPRGANLDVRPEPASEPALL